MKKIVYNLAVGFCFASLLFAGERASAKSVRLIHGHESLIQNADFDPNWSRYPSPLDILVYFNTTLPLVPRTFVDPNCLAVSSTNRNLLGIDDPVIGSPLMKKPSAEFVSWYTGCVKGVLNAEQAAFLGATPAGSQALPNDKRSQIIAGFGAGGVMNSCSTVLAGSGLDPKSPDSAVLILSTCEWASLSMEIKKATVRYWIHELIGPEDVIKDLGIEKTSGDLTQSIIDSIDEFAARPSDVWSFLSISNSQSLRVPDAVRMIQFLTMITDAFEY